MLVICLFNSSVGLVWISSTFISTYTVCVCVCVCVTILLYFLSTLTWAFNTDYRVECESESILLNNFSCIRNNTSLNMVCIASNKFISTCTRQHYIVYSAPGTAGLITQAMICVYRNVFKQCSNTPGESKSAARHSASSHLLLLPAA